MLIPCICLLLPTHKRVHGFFDSVPSSLNTIDVWFSRAGKNSYLARSCEEVSPKTECFVEIATYMHKEYTVEV